MSYPFIFPYKAGSKSVGILSQAIPAKIIKREKSKFKASESKLVINWGAVDAPENLLAGSGRILNPPTLLRNASNKVRFFEACAQAGNVPIPPFSQDKNVAADWIRDGRTIVARHELAGHSGAGIEIVETAAQFDALRDGVLMVQYIPKKLEFRIHVSRDHGIFSIQQKLVKRDFPKEEINYKVRNLQGGYIYARGNVNLPSNACADAAVNALRATGLDFGAVDIIWNERHKSCYVLEINTAPGLEGTTAEEYAELFRKYSKEA